MWNARVSSALVAVLLPVGLLLGGCAGSGATVTSSTTASVDPSTVTGTVTFWDTSAPAEAVAVKALVSDFEKQYPNIKVAYTPVAFETAKEKYKDAAKVGQAPDVMRAEAGWTAEFASLGFLQPLDQTPLGKDTDAYLKLAFTSNEYQGQQFGVPQVTDAAALLCNGPLLKKAGVPVPRTWEDMKLGAAKVKAAGATFLYAPPQGYFTMPYVLSQGGQMIDVAEKQVLINEAPSVAGYQTALDLISSGAAVAPSGANPYTSQQQLFRAGKVACIINGPWSVSDALSSGVFQQNPDALTVNKIPNGDQAGASLVGGQNYVVYAGSKSKDASYIFLGYLNSAASQTRLANATGLLPSRQAAYEGVTNRFVKDWKPVMDAAKDSPWIPELSQMYESMDLQWRKMYSKQETPQVGTDNMAKAWLQFLPKDYTDDRLKTQSP